MSEPPDDADGLLDAGWSGALTARSTGSLLALSGEAKLNLRDAALEELQERFGLSAEQSAALYTFAKGNNARMEMLLVQDLTTLATGGGGRNNSQQPAGRQSGRSSAGRSGGQPGAGARIQALDNHQLRRIFQEGTLDRADQPINGKVNLNTVSPAVLRAMLPDDPISADAIVSLRGATSSGLLSIYDLLGSNRITPESVAAIAPYADTQSYVFTVTSRGRSSTTGLEVEITAVIDRSTLPARILEYREQ